MKKSKIYLIPILLLCLSLLAGCGSQEGGTPQSNSQQMSISLPSSSSEESSEAASLIRLPRTVKKADTDLIGMQFYQGKAVEIRRERVLGEVKRESQDIYIYDMLENGSIALQGANGEYNGKWYFAEDGYCLAIWRNSLIRIEPDGTETFNEIIENGVVDICQLSDGRIMMIITDVSGDMKLAELNPETGEYTKFDSVKLTKDRRQYIGTRENSVLLLNTTGFWEVDPETGDMTSAASWENYDYTLGFLVQDFRLAESGVAEIILNEKVDTLMPNNLKAIRTVITVCDLDGSEDYQTFVDLFNQTNQTYFVEVQEINEFDEEELYKERNTAALLAGGGADIILSSAVSDVHHLIQNGAFEDLGPYLEKSDFFEDDYFRSALRFREGEKVHGISIYGSAEGLGISNRILEDSEVPKDAEALVDALLNYTGEEVFHSDWDSAEVLNYFLCGSEDLWGMIDWKNGTCDFGGVLFAKMLEAAKLYGNDGQVGLSALAETVGSKFYNFNSEAALNEKGMVYVGYILDEGCYIVANPKLEFAINSNSPNKEGAWELNCFPSSRQFKK